MPFELTVTTTQTVHRADCRYASGRAWPRDDERWPVGNPQIEEDEVLAYLGADERPCARCLPHVRAQLADTMLALDTTRRARARLTPAPSAAHAIDRVAYLLACPLSTSTLARAAAEIVRLLESYPEPGLDPFAFLRPGPA